MKKAIFAAMLCSVIAIPAHAGMDKKHYDRMGHGDKQAKMMHWVDKMDTNNDGVVSMQEHERFSANMFYKTDQNNDNVLTKQEISSYMHKKRDQWKNNKDMDGYNR